MPKQFTDSGPTARAIPGVRELIAERLVLLEIGRAELVRRWGYTNATKGLRRLDQICDGMLVPSRDLLDKLAMTLELPTDVVTVAFAATKENIRIREQTAKAGGEAFEPHGLLLGSQPPSQIVLYGITGGADRWLRITLDLKKPPLTYPQQALAAARRTPVVPFHGRTTGFVVNFATDRAVRFDVVGNPVEVLPKVYVPGQAEVTIGGCKIDANDHRLYRV